MADFATQPVDYGQLISAVPNPLAQEGAMAQISTERLQGQAIQQGMALREIQLRRQMAFGQALGSYVKNPTSQGLADLFGAFPEFEQQAAAARSALDRGDITELGSAAALAAKGDYDGAANIVQQRIDAEKANGTDTSQAQHVLQLLQSKDPAQQRAALGALSLGVAVAVGPDKAADFLKANGLSSEPIPVKGGDTLMNEQGQTIAYAPLPNSPQTLNEPGGGQELVSYNPNPGAAGGSGGTGTVSTGGGGPVSGAGAAAPAGTPRSVRNNNPGNLRVSPFTKNQPGFQGADDAGYAIFDSPQSGAAAQTALLMGKGYFGGGRQSVGAIIEKWAPRKSKGGDNTDAQVNNYISYVSRAVGVKPGQKLTPAQLPAVAQAMQQFEAGATGHAGPVRVPPTTAANVSGGAAPAATGAVAPQSGVSVLANTGSPTALNTKDADPGFSWNADHTAEIPTPNGPEDPRSYNPQEIDDLARNWIITGSWGSGGGMGGGNIPNGLKKAAMSRASSIMQSIGVSSDQLPQLRSQYAADKSSLSNINGTLSGLQASEKALHLNAQQVFNTQAKLVKDGIIDNGAPFLNDVRLGTYKHVGSAQTKADIKAYEDAMNAYAVEYAKFMSSANGIGGSAAPSDSSQERAADLNDTAMGPAALKAHINQTLIEAANRRQGIEGQAANLNGRLASYLQPHKASAPTGVTQIHTVQQYQSLPHGAHYIDPNGVRRIKP